MRGWILGVTLATSALVVGGCGSVDGSAPPPPAAVTGPWQPGPFEPLDHSLAAAAEARCRERTPQAIDLPVVLHDQRGDGVDTVLFAGPTGRASCQVARDESGRYTWLAGSATTDPVTADPTKDDITIDGMGSTSGSDTGTVSDISGRTGKAIASLRIRLDDGREVVATTSNGWFYAWWPGESVAITLFGDDATGRQVASAIP